MATAISIVNKALSLAGVATVIKPADPLLINESFNELVDMLNEFVELGLSLNITIPTDSADEVGNPAWSDAAFRTMLAVRVGPIFQKDTPIAVKVRAFDQENILLTRSAPFPLPEYPDNLPIGSGNERGPKSRVYYPPIDDALKAEIS